MEYWDSAARNYDDNIFSTIDEDATGIITRVIDWCSRAAVQGPPSRCVDLGCGAGKYLPALSKRFPFVFGYDLSPQLVALARTEAKRLGLQNVEVKVRDLSQIWYRDGEEVGGRAEMGSYDFAVMANVLIAPGPSSLHYLMLQNGFRSLSPGGRLLAIIPSLESALYVNMRCEEAEYEGPYAVGTRRSDDGESLRLPSRAEGADLVHGILRRSGVRTKHFLEPEFRLLASKVGFEVEYCDKVNYSWRSELGLGADSHVPPQLRQPPLPWDWLFLLRRPATAALPAAKGGGLDCNTPWPSPPVAERAEHAELHFCEVGCTASWASRMPIQRAESSTVAASGSFGQLPSLLSRVSPTPSRPESWSSGRTTPAPSCRRDA